MKIETKYEIGQEVWFFYFGYKPLPYIVRKFKFEECYKKYEQT